MVMIYRKDILIYGNTKKLEIPCELAHNSLALKRAIHSYMRNICLPKNMGT